MNSSTSSATYNPLAALRDALHALGPDQVDQAKADVRTWLAGKWPTSPTEVAENSVPPTPTLSVAASVESEAPTTPTPFEPQQTADGEGDPSPSASVSPGSPSLDAFQQTLRDYQEAVLNDAFDFIEECWAEKHDRQRILYISPTGTGKGSMQLALLKELRAQEVDAWILTPSLEVLRGFLERTGAGSMEGVSEDKLAKMGEEIFCTTPVRMHNRILEGVRNVPEVVLYDEAHHAVAGNSVSGTLFAIAPAAVWLGFTATGFRASPQATALLHEDWGEPVEVMTIPDAVNAGYQSLPSFHMAPLVDDDEIKVYNGEFQAKASNALHLSRIRSLAELVREEFVDDLPGETVDVLPTAVIVPSSEVAGRLVEDLDELGIEARWIHSKTKAKDRAVAYERCKQGLCVLVSIKVINEGVDMPWLRQLIDARPTISPVSWLQTIGRIMRPGPVRPRYVCTNRNLERHAYLMQGAVPRKAIAEAQAAFDKPSKRAGIRQLGLQALSRFKAIPLPLDGDVNASMYSVYNIDSETGVKTEYLTILDPCDPKPYTTMRKVQPKPADAEKRTKDCYGKWAKTEMPLEFEGFATTPSNGKLSKKMREWWERDARRYGLSDRNIDAITRRQFQALPVLANTKHNLRGDA